MTAISAPTSRTHIFRWMMTLIVRVTIVRYLCAVHDVDYQAQAAVCYSHNQCLNWHVSDIWVHSSDKCNSAAYMSNYTCRLGDWVQFWMPWKHPSSQSPVAVPRVSTCFLQDPVILVSFPNSYSRLQPGSLHESYAFSVSVIDEGHIPIFVGPWQWHVCHPKFECLHESRD